MVNRENEVFNFISNIGELHYSSIIKEIKEIVKNKKEKETERETKRRIKKMEKLVYQ